MVVAVKPQQCSASMVAPAVAAVAGVPVAPAVTLALVEVLLSACLSRR